MGKRGKFSEEEINFINQIPLQVYVFLLLPFLLLPVGQVLLLQLVFDFVYDSVSLASNSLGIIKNFKHISRWHV